MGGDEDSTWEAFRASIIAGRRDRGIPFWGWDLAGFSARSRASSCSCAPRRWRCSRRSCSTTASSTTTGQPSNDRTPWNLAERHGDDRAITIYRKLAHLHERLVPHLVRWAEWPAQTGTPMMRPLWFDDPDDTESWNHPYQYRFGPDLIIAPACWPDIDTINVYLPAGEWINA